MQPIATSALDHVVRCLHAAPPKQSGIEAFTLWLLNQKWDGNDLIELLDKERSMKGWTEEAGILRLRVARRVSGIYEDDGLTLAREQRWSFDTACAKLIPLLNELDSGKSD